ncbi:sensor histidine kinase [Paenibacillus sp.]|jgi:two-component system sensor histidine kinase YesM|uniref:cache domain-containing sensor histidine kinase n=1 Tax=Paenibacillus sp. TaxID=58172 RepID=UPI002838FBD3|nr:sensor histidine kinase [Paenibacillus sp.]MDR0268089.1 sensor histidine kinase [Paenibacillus sp.]
MKIIRENGKKLGYIPIGYKLMLSYMIFIIIFVSVNGYVSHSMYDASMRKQTKTNIQGTVLQIRDNVAYKTDDIIRVSSLLYDDYGLTQSLRMNEYSKQNNDRMYQIIIPKLESAAKSIGFSQRLFVYFHNETVSEIYRTRVERGSTELVEQTYDIFHIKRIIEKDWYKEIPKEVYGETMQWKQIEQDAEEDRISLIRRLVDTYNPLDLEEIGVMRFSVRLRDLFESVDYAKLGEGSTVIVKDAGGKIIYASGMPAHGSDDSAAAKGKYITIKETMAKQGWLIEANVPVTIIEQEAKKVRTFIISMCVLCFVLFTFAGIFISRYFAIRIMKFVSVLNAFREGDLHKRINYRGKDEFSQIATALNGMGEDFETLINKVYLAQLQKKEAELEMLQLQINPHFLYNTLSSISRLAKFGENEKLQKMVVELAKFYRLTLNSGRTVIPVSSEIEQSGAYLAIQKVKYGRRLEVTFDIDVNIWPYETIKLILQPFIENVLKHAWSGDRIHIRIAAHLEEDMIVYSIIDDGMGMRAPRIKEILDPSSESETGYGIRNIDQRIKLQYGAEYGVAIVSRPGIGTTAQIKIPAKKRKVFL